MAKHEWMEREENLEVDLEQPIELSVSNGSGEINVRATERDDVKVRFEGSGPGRVTVAGDDNRIAVRVDASRSFDLGGFAKGVRSKGKAGADKGPKVEWDLGLDLDDLIPGARGGGNFDLWIEVPAAAPEVRLKVGGASGEVTVEDVRGQIDAKVASGDLSLRRVFGDISARSASGDIAIADARGGLRVQSASGDIGIDSTDLERYTIQTASGDIRLRGVCLVGTGSFRIDTVSGDIEVEHPIVAEVARRGLALEFKTVSGDARVSPPLEADGKRRWVYQVVGSDAMQVGVRSVSGDLHFWTSFDEAGEDALSFASAESHGPRAPRPPKPPRAPRPARPARPARPPRHAISGLGEQIAADVQAALADAKTALEDALRARKSAVDIAAATPFAVDLARQTLGGVRRAFNEARQSMEDAAQAAEGEARAAEIEAMDAALEAEEEALEAELEAMEAALDAEGDAPEAARDGAEARLPRHDVPVAMATNEQSPSAESEAERLAILTALEEGEIDIDEALRRLEPLGGETPDLSVAGGSHTG